MVEIGRLRELRNGVWREVLARDGWRCVLCGRKADDVHEIEQRSHHPRSKQEEAGTFSLTNCVSLCRTCHQRWGQHRNAEWMFKVILHARYGYPPPMLKDDK